MRDEAARDGRLSVGTWALAVAVGVVAFAAASVFALPGLDPSFWREIAIVAGIDRPTTILPGLWRLLARVPFGFCGIDDAIGVLGRLGALTAALCAALFFLVVRQILALLYRGERIHAVWSRGLAPFFSVLAAVLLAASDPLGRIGGCLSAAGLHLLAFLLVVHLLLRWFVIGGAARLFAAMALMGVLSAESPLGLVLPLAFVFFYISVWRCVMDGFFAPPPTLPDMSRLPVWRMIFLFLGGFLLTAWGDSFAYAFGRKLAANGWNMVDIYLLYGRNYVHAIVGAASLLGWLLGFGLCVVPLVVAIRLFPAMVRDDRRLPFSVGALMLFVGFVALLQCGAFQSTRFWKFSADAVQVRSDFLLAFLVLAAVMTVTLMGAALAFACQRLYRPVGDFDADEPEVEVALKPAGLWLRCLMPVVCVLLAAMAVRSYRKPVEAEMRRIVDDVVAETVRECEGAKWVFTDGMLDAAIRLEAARRGVTLTPLDMMSADRQDESELRRLFGDDAESLRSISVGVPMLLRMWASEKPNGLDESAVQLGFEFWRRERKALPEMSGLVARTRWPSPEAVTNGIVRTEAIARRITALAGRVKAVDPSPALANAFSAAAWRISRLARLRSDDELADELDLGNGALRHMIDVLEQERTKTFTQFTPREGLQIALKRADFANAMMYAKTVLRFDDEDPEANFAMGMGSLMRRRMDEVERYLRKCLIRRPNEPAVLNNLSIIYRKARKYAEAEKFARRALEIMPDAPEIKKTYEDAKNNAP